MAKGKVITVAQQKGGAGKTTVATHLAVLWSQQGHEVAVVDIDPQGSLSTWYDLRRQALGDACRLTFHAITGWRVAGEIDRLQKHVDIILIDTPPHAETEARIAVRAADLVIIPAQPNPMDLWATRPTLALAAEEKVKSLVVLNRVPARCNLTAQMTAAFEELDLDMAETRLGNRVVFASAFADGVGVTEHNRRLAASREVALLGDEILGRIGLTDKAGKKKKKK